jgi:hypothetical protein
MKQTKQKAAGSQIRLMQPWGKVRSAARSSRPILQ